MNSRLTAVCSTACISLVLAACAQGTLTRDEFKQYANLNLPEFLSRRFNDSHSIRVENTVRYIAIFNEYNYQKLSLPTEEIFQFCKSGFGNITRIRPYSDMPIGQYFSAKQLPANRYEKMMADLAAERSKYSFFPEQPSATRLREANRKIIEFRTSGDGIGVALQAYQKVSTEGTYGKFKCIYEMQPERNWTIDVTPVEFVGSAADTTFGNPKLIIEIAP